MNNFCPFVKAWKSEQIYAGMNFLPQDFNDHPTIIQEIKNVDFPNLKVIYLTSNQIESLEGLNRIHIPLLMKLNLSKYGKYEGQNFISSIAEFKKVNWKKMETIECGKTKIIKGETLY